jgi:hypothetical protein
VEKVLDIALIAHLLRPVGRVGNTRILGRHVKLLADFALKNGSLRFDRTLNSLSSSSHPLQDISCVTINIFRERGSWTVTLAATLATFLATALATFLATALATITFIFILNFDSDIRSEN